MIVLGQGVTAGLEVAYLTSCERLVSENVGWAPVGPRIAGNETAQPSWSFGCPDLRIWDPGLELWTGLALAGYTHTHGWHSRLALVGTGLARVGTGWHGVGTGLARGWHGLARVGTCTLVYVLQKSGDGKLKRKASSFIDGRRHFDLGPLRSGHSLSVMSDEMIND